eukprot:m.33565 g.33565  ORF g.33565 m.33565 type:complete len:1808 (-) comp9479_c0_seq1:27-5450(-)
MLAAAEAVCRGHVSTDILQTIQEFITTATLSPKTQADKDSQKSLSRIVSSSAKYLAGCSSPSLTPLWAELAHESTQFYLNTWKKSFATDPNMLKLLLMLVGGLAQQKLIDRAVSWADKILIACAELDLSAENRPPRFEEEILPLLMKAHSVRLRCFQVQPTRDQATWHSILSQTMAFLDALQAAGVVLPGRALHQRVDHVVAALRVFPSAAVLEASAHSHSLLRHTPTPPRFSSAALEQTLAACRSSLSETTLHDRGAAPHEGWLSSVKSLSAEIARIHMHLDESSSRMLLSLVCSIDDAGATTHTWGLTRAASLLLLDYEGGLSVARDKIQALLAGPTLPSYDNIEDLLSLLCSHGVGSKTTPTNTLMRTVMPAAACWAFQTALSLFSSSMKTAGHAQVLSAQLVQDCATITKTLSSLDRLKFLAECWAALQAAPTGQASQVQANEELSSISAVLGARLLHLFADTVVANTAACTGVARDTLHVAVACFCKAAAGREQAHEQLWALFYRFEHEYEQGRVFESDHLSPTIAAQVIVGSADDVDAGPAQPPPRRTHTEQSWAYFAMISLLDKLTLLFTSESRFSIVPSLSPIDLVGLKKAQLEGSKVVTHGNPTVTNTSTTASTSISSVCSIDITLFSSPLGRFLALAQASMALQQTQQTSQSIHTALMAVAHMPHAPSIDVEQALTSSCAHTLAHAIALDCYRAFSHVATACRAAMQLRSSLMPWAGTARVCGVLAQLQPHASAAALWLARATDVALIACSVAAQARLEEYSSCLCDSGSCDGCGACLADIKALVPPPAREILDMLEQTVSPTGDAAVATTSPTPSLSLHDVTSVHMALLSAHTLLRLRLPGPVLSIVDREISAQINLTSTRPPSSHNEALLNTCVLVELLMAAGQAHLYLGNTAKARFYFEKVTTQALLHGLSAAHATATTYIDLFLTPHTPLTEESDGAPTVGTPHALLPPQVTCVLHALQNATIVSPYCVSITLKALASLLSTLALPAAAWEDLSITLGRLSSNAASKGQFPLLSRVTTWFDATRAGVQDAALLVSMLDAMPLGLSLSLLQALLCRAESTASMSVPSPLVAHDLARMVETVDSQASAGATSASALMLPVFALDDAEQESTHASNIPQSQDKVSSRHIRTTTTAPSVSCISAAGPFPRDLASLERHYAAHTVVQLRAMARARGLSTSGLKAVLVARLARSAAAAKVGLEERQSGHPIVEADESKGKECAATHDDDDGVSPGEQHASTVEPDALSTALGAMQLAPPESSMQQAEIVAPVLPSFALDAALDVEALFTAAKALYVRTTVTSLASDPSLSAANTGQGLDARATAAALLLRAWLARRGVKESQATEGWDGQALAVLLLCDLQEASFLQRCTALRQWPCMQSVPLPCSIPLSSASIDAALCERVKHFTKTIDALRPDSGPIVVMALLPLGPQAAPHEMDSEMNGESEAIADLEVPLSPTRLMIAHIAPGACPLITAVLLPQRSFLDVHARIIRDSEACLRSFADIDSAHDAADPHSTPIAPARAAHSNHAARRRLWQQLVQLDGELRDNLTAAEHALAACRAWLASHSAHSIVLILDDKLEAFPFESMPCLRSRAVSRHTSFSSALPRHKMECHITYDPATSFFVTNPSGDLSRFHDALTVSFQQRGWRGLCNARPDATEVADALTNSTIYLFNGHNAGEAFLPLRDLDTIACRAAVLLMGCRSYRSVSLNRSAACRERSVPAAYLNSGAPAVVCTLWRLGSSDISALCDLLVKQWLPPDSNPSRHLSSLPAALSVARMACRLPFLTGAATVVYGTVSLTT